MKIRARRILALGCGFNVVIPLRAEATTEFEEEVATDKALTHGNNAERDRRDPSSANG